MVSHALPPGDTFHAATLSPCARTGAIRAVPRYNELQRMMCLPKYIADPFRIRLDDDFM
jgi:hypothetical protein